MLQWDDVDRAPIGIHCPNKPSSSNYINIAVTFPPLKVKQLRRKSLAVYIYRVLFIHSRSNITSQNKHYINREKRKKKQLHKTILYLHYPIFIIRTASTYTISWKITKIIVHTLPSLRQFYSQQIKYLCVKI